MHRWSRAAVRFDEQNLVSCAGLVPVMRLAERAGLSDLVGGTVRITNPPMASTGTNPAGKVTSIVAGMAAGADSIDDLDVIRHGGMPRLFGGVYAPSTLGSFLRACTHGHTRQLAAVARKFLINLVARTPVLAGAAEMAYVDVDSLLRRVYGKQKQGAGFGHTKVGGYPVLLRGLSPLVATICTPIAAPVIAAIRLRGGSAGSARGAACLVAEALTTAKAAGARAGRMLLRADSAFYSGAVISAARRAGARFSITVTGNCAVRAAIAGIDQDAWIPVRYPGAVTDPDTGELISEAEVAETSYTAFAANAAWTICTAICHNLLRAAGSLTSRFHAKARGATLRRHLINIPARLAEPQGHPVLHLPTHWPWTNAWTTLHAATGPR